jgi:hypothetical protein
LDGNKNYQKLHQFVTSLNFSEMYGTKNIKVDTLSIPRMDSRSDAELNIRTTTVVVQSRELGKKTVMMQNITDNKNLLL